MYPDPMDSEDSGKMAGMLRLILSSDVMVFAFF